MRGTSADRVVGGAVPVFAGLPALPPCAHCRVAMAAFTAAGTYVPQVGDMTGGGLALAISAAHSCWHKAEFQGSSSMPPLVR